MLSSFIDFHETKSPKNVCLICLKTFVQNGDNSNAIVGSVDDEDNQQQSGHSDLYSRFLQLTGRYLKVSASDALLALVKQRESEIGRHVEVFCDQCQILVANICDFYAELQVIKLKLLGRVDKLERVTRASVETVSTKLSGHLFKALAEQLNVGSTSRLELFRKNIILCCQRKAKTSNPQVLVPRGLFPEQWTFSYSATKLVLMRLIVIFALSAEAAKQTKQDASQISLMTEYDSERIWVSNQDGDSNLHSENINLEGDGYSGTCTDDNDNKPGNFPDIERVADSDSDWSVGAASLSERSDSSEPHTTNSVPHNDNNNTYPKSRPQRLTKLAKVVCEEDAVETTQNAGLKRRKVVANEKQKINLEHVRHPRVIHKTSLEYFCSICDYKTSSSLSLIAHESIVHRKRKRQSRCPPKVTQETDKFAKVPCEVCSVAWESGPMLRMHLNREHEQVLEEKKVFPCKFCYMKFAYAQTLQLHVAAIHRREYKFVCDAESCNEHFVNSLQLNKHIETVHLLVSGMDPVKLEAEPSGHGDCIANPESSERNDRVSKVNSISYCKTCNCGFVNPDMLKLHQIVHIKCDDNNLYPCPGRGCQEKVRKKAKLMNHFNWTHGKQMKIFKCLECPQTYLSGNGLHWHVSQHNKPLRNYVKNRKGSKFHCRQCNGSPSFKSHFHLFLHQKQQHHSSYSFLEINKRRENENEMMERIVEQPSLNCPHCPNREFTRRDALGKHLSVVHQICNICGYKATSRNKLKLHRSEHIVKRVRKTRALQLQNRHVPIPNSIQQRISAMRNLNTDIYDSVPCQVCQKTFGSGPNLRKHLNTEHEQIPDEEKAISCGVCCMKFAHEQTHELHYIVAHVKAYKFVCDADSCTAHFLNRNDLNCHLESVHLESSGTEGKAAPQVEKVESISYCTTCKWGFVNAYSLQLHELTHSIVHNDRARLYQCPVCMEYKKDVMAAVGHYNVAHGRRLKVFKCLECPMKSLTHATLLKHIARHNRKTVDGNEETPKKDRNEQQHNCNNFICPEMGCAQVYNSRLEHRKGRNPSIPPTYPVICPVEGCGKHFLSWQRMVAHKKKVHEAKYSGKCFLCSFCGLSFFTKHTRNAHERYVHEPPQYECDICHKMFRRSSARKEHKQRMHNPDPLGNSHVCSECGNVFKTPSGLQYHRESAHTPEDEKRFACPHCQYRTQRKSLFRFHLKTCLKNKGLPYDEKECAKLLAAMSKNVSP